MKTITSPRFIYCLLAVASCASVAVAQSASIPTASQYASFQPKFELKVQFSNSITSPRQMKVPIMIGQFTVEQINYIPDPDGSEHHFNVISASLSPAIRGSYPVVVTLGEHGGAHFCIENVSRLTLTPDKPYIWRPLPSQNRPYFVTLISIKPQNQQPKAPIPATPKPPKPV